MIVVADTSPINYLVQIGHEHLLPQLYGFIAIPEAVHRELLDKAAPAELRKWAESLPTWASVQHLIGPPARLSKALHAGESEALQLALQIRADLVLIDERRGTTAARAIGLQTTGTLGILRNSHLAGFIDGREVYQILRRTTNFRVNSSAADLFLQSLP